MNGYCPHSYLTFHHNLMKKSTIVIILIVLGICGLVGCVGGILLYFMLRETPDTAFSAAATEIVEGDYYKYNQTATMAINMTAVQYEYQMQMEEDGEIDIQNHKKHYTTTETYDGESELSETYVIDNTQYVSYNGGTYETQTAAQSPDLMELLVQDFIDSGSYTTQENQTVNGVECYHYTMNLTTDQEQDIATYLTETSDPEYAFTDTDMGTVTYDIWIDKDNQQIAKIRMTVDEITGLLTASGESTPVSITDVVLQATFTDWGVPVTIEEP